MTDVVTAGRRLAEGLIAGALILLVLLTLSSADTAHATTFNPTASICLDDFATTADCDGDSTPGANSDLTTEFGILAPDSIFGGVVGFVSEALSPAAGPDIPDGAVVARLFSLAQLGLLGSACNTPVPVEFIMLDASTNMSDTIDTAKDPLPPGVDDSFAPLQSDANNNGIPDGADRMPSYIPEIFPGLTPVSRQFGTVDVSGISVVLIFMSFPAGTTFPAVPDLGLEGGTVDARLGIPSVVILQDPTVSIDQASLNTITDFCAPLQSMTTTFGLTKDNGCTPAPGPPQCDADSTLFKGAVIQDPPAGGAADESGHAYRTNPSGDRTLTAQTFAISLRDADDDGIETILDPCPLVPNPGWDPRAVSNPDTDPDGDSLPSDPGCDPQPLIPSPIVGAAKDQDLDGIDNRSDNCALLPNAQPGDSFQKDSDNDGIGDICDPNPNDPDGHRHEVCLVDSFDIGAGGNVTFEDIRVDPTDNTSPICAGVAVFAGRQNQPPECAGVEITAFAGETTPSFSLNCSDPDGDSLTCSVVTDGSKGTLDITSCTSATYTPDANATGADTVTYKANDGEDDSNTATGSVTIEGDADGDGVIDANDLCPGTPPGDVVDEVGDASPGCSEAQKEALEEETKEELIAEAQAGQTSVAPVFDTVIAGGSTNVIAICADENANPLSDVEITFKVDQQPGSDANLDGQTEVKNTTDAEGFAEATLNVGSTAGDIVLSATAAECDTATATVTVKEATVAGGTGDDTAVLGTGGGTGTGAAGGAATGVGSLAPAIASIPTWAAIASGLGLTGLLGGLGTFVARILRRRR